MKPIEERQTPPICRNCVILMKRLGTNKWFVFAVDWSDACKPGGK